MASNPACCCSSAWPSLHLSHLLSLLLSSLLLLFALPATHSPQRGRERKERKEEEEASGEWKTMSLGGGGEKPRFVWLGWMLFSSCCLHAAQCLCAWRWLPGHVSSTHLIPLSSPSVFSPLSLLSSSPLLPILLSLSLSSCSLYISLCLSVGIL